jgi:hypothetical protein
MPVAPSPVMMHQPGPPPPYAVHKQTPIGWAINEIPPEHPAPGKKNNYSANQF